MPTGTYLIGGWEDPTNPFTPPFVHSFPHSLSAFWVARLPITVAQFTRFVEEGYRDTTHWTPHGIKWRGERTAPYRWGDPRFSEPNQPVVGVTWYEATAYSHWLMSHLAAALPADYIIRLPTEAEWEAAVAFADPEDRRAYPWGPEEPTPERAVYDAWQLNAPAPVGLCPAGMAVCGALDLGGNVWEWTSSSYHAYPDKATALEKDFTISDPDVPLRGGAYWNNSTSVRCGARNWYRPDDWYYAQGLRVVLSTALTSPE